MENIIMKDLLDYPHIYAVTKDGKIWSYRSNHFLKNRVKKNGETSIELNYKGQAKTYSVSRLVYSTWRDIPLQDISNYIVKFLDKNNQNISIDNLYIEQIKNFELNEEIKIISVFPEYGATKDGKIWSLKTNKFLTPKISDNNSEIVTLTTSNGKKYCSVHRLILLAWNPVENWEKLQVNHKDENRRNNNLENLEWCTSEYNINYGTRNKRVSNKLKKKIRCIETGEIFDSINDAAKTLNQKSARTNLSSCLHGRQKTCGGYHWEFVEKEGEENV